MANFDPTTAKPIAFDPTSATLDVGGGAQPTELQSWLNTPGVRLAHDLADPVLGLSHMLASGGAWAASLGHHFDNPLSAYYQAAADATKGAQDAINGPMAAANAAARNTPGYTGARTAADADEAKSSLGVLDQVTAPVLPAVDSAVAWTKQAGLNAGKSLTGQPITTPASDAANATYDAETKNLGDYRAAHPVTSTVAALAPALLTLGDAALPAIKTLATSSRGAGAAVPSIAALRNAATNAYKTVDSSGMTIAQPAVRNLVSDIQSDLTARGFHPKLQPNTAAVFGELSDAANNNQTLQGMDVLRRIAQNGADTINKSDKMMARGIVDKIDDFVGNLGPQDVIGNVDQPALDALSNARDLWARAAKGQQIQSLIDKAALNGQSMQSVGSGQALRTQFRNLANNNRAMARFAPDEQDAIRKVANGGPIENVARLIGKLSPDHVIPALAEGNAALGALATGNIPAAAVAGGTAIAGAAGKLAANALTARNAQIVSELVRRGVPASVALQVSSPLALRSPNAAALLASGLNLAQQQQRAGVEGGNQ